MDADAARHALAGERERLERDLAHLRGDMGAEPRDSAERLDAGPDDAVATYDHEFDEGVAEDLEAAIASVRRSRAIGRSSTSWCRSAPSSRPTSRPTRKRGCARPSPPDDQPASHSRAVCASRYAFRPMITAAIVQAIPDSSHPFAKRPILRGSPV